MKVFKKLSMLFVAAAMMMTTTTTAFAADDSMKNSMKDGQGSVQINRDGAEYKAYKILDSKTKSTGGKDIAVYTVNKDYEDFFKTSGYTFVADEGILFNGTKVASTDEIRNENKTDGYKQSDDMKALTKALIEYTTDKIQPTQILGNVETKLNQGYYLVLENTTTITGNKNTGRVPSQAMLMDVKDGSKINIFPKDSDLKIEKSVEGGKVSVGGVGVKQDFKISSTVPTYAYNFKNVKYNVTDTMSSGLTLDINSITVKVAGEVVMDKGVITKKEYFNNFESNKNADGVTITEFDFNYEGLRTASKMGATVEITYQAEINEKAAVYDPNTNTAKIEYTTTPGGEHSAIEDKTETYTYAIDLVKKDGSNKDTVLPGAEFELRIVDGSADGKVLKTVTSDANGKIHFTGLAEGTYTLRETKAPSSEYAMLDGEIKFEITANEDKATCTVRIVDGDASITNDATANNGVISFEIYNYKGISLPETGGMGTTIFMIGGASLIALAGVMLVVYSKKSKKA